jgi:hypothetical protein
MDTRFQILDQKPTVMFFGIYLTLKDGSKFTNLPTASLQRHFSTLFMNNSTSVVDAHMHMFHDKKDPASYSELLLMTMDRVKRIVIV